jgi:excisionase family DNA binding protein
MIGRLLTVKEAAEALRVSEATVRALVEKKLLRHVRVGTGRGRVLIPEDAIEEHLQARTVEATGGQGTKPAPATSPPRKYRHLKV